MLCDAHGCALNDWTLCGIRGLCDRGELADVLDRMCDTFSSGTRPVYLWINWILRRLYLSTHRALWLYDLKDYLLKSGAL